MAVWPASFRRTLMGMRPPISPIAQMKCYSGHGVNRCDRRNRWMISCPPELRLPLLHEGRRSFLEIRGSKAFSELLYLALHAVGAGLITGVHCADGGGQSGGGVFHDRGGELVALGSQFGLRYNVV